MTTMASRTEASDSYYSGCRKANNCLCEMCIESINATRDLMPSGLHRSNLANTTPTSKVSSLCLESTPNFGTQRFVRPSPISKTCQAVESSATSTTTSEPMARQIEGVRKKKEKYGNTGFAFKRLIAAFCLFLMMDLAFICLSGELLRTIFLPETIHGIAIEALHLENVKDQACFVQTKLKEIGFRNVKDCNSVDSAWEIKKDGLLLHSKCILYKSMVEEISIWGWPLQTEGLLVTGFNRRSITILSGQLIEWTDGKMDFTPRRKNSSWTNEEFTARAVKLDAMTWMLEHSHLALKRDVGFFQAVIKFCKISLQEMFEALKNKLLVLLLIQEPKTTFMPYEDYRTPT